MKNEFEFEKNDDGLNDLTQEEKKSKKGLFFLLFLIFLGIIFYGYIVLAPTRGSLALAFDNIPKVVYEPETNISGSNVKPGSRLRMIINGGEPQFLIADENGKFSTKIELDEGDNKIEVSTVEANDSNQQSATTYITYEVKGPKLIISEPVDNAEIKVTKGTKTKEIVIKGTTDSGVKLTINDNVVLIKSDGSFEVKYEVKLGDNTINIVADNGKKTTKEEISVKLVEETAANSNNTTTQPKTTNTTNNTGNNSSGSSNSSSSNNTSNTTNNTSNNQTNTEPEPQPLVIYPSKVIISYIAYSNDENAAGYGEYIEIKNTGGEDKDITGWTVSDGDGNSFTFPSYVLTPGATVRLTTNMGRFLFNSSSPVWARVGEPGYLKDASGRLVDVYSY